MRLQSICNAVGIWPAAIGAFMFVVGGMCGFMTTQVPHARVRVTPTLSQVKFAASQPVRTAFQVYNDGNAPLLITGIEPECNCIIPQPLKTTVLKPHESEALVIAFDNVNADAGRPERIALQTNDPDQPITAVTVIMAPGSAVDNGANDVMLGEDNK
jgi:uncharacterized protein DUF1573